MKKTFGNMEDTHLAEVYVQDFELEQLGVGPVKREPSPSANKIPWNSIDEDDVAPSAIRVRSINAPPNSWHHNEDRRLHTFSPQIDSHQTIPPNQNIVVNGVSGVPTTPPETPPHVYSPGFQGPIYNPHYMQMQQQRQQTAIMDDMMWLPQTMRGEQPLDLRPLPNGIEGNDWDRREYLQQQPNGQSMVNLPSHLQHLEVSNCYPSHAQANYPMYNRPMSVSSTRSSCTISPRQSNPNHSGSSQSSRNSDAQNAIADELLTKLSVRELNKRLHGCPREEIVRLKQNCRSKRMHQRHELERANRKLVNDLDSARSKISELTIKIEMLEKRLQRTHLADGSHDLHSDGHSSPEFYL